MGNQTNSLVKHKELTALEGRRSGYYYKSCMGNKYYNLAIEGDADAIKMLSNSQSNKEKSLEQYAYLLDAFEMINLSEGSFAKDDNYMVDWREKNYPPQILVNHLIDSGVEFPIPSKLLLQELKCLKKRYQITLLDLIHDQNKLTSEYESSKITNMQFIMQELSRLYPDTNFGPENFIYSALNAIAGYRNLLDVEYKNQRAALQLENLNENIATTKVALELGVIDKHTATKNIDYFEKYKNFEIEHLNNDVNMKKMPKAKKEVLIEKLKYLYNNLPTCTPKNKEVVTGVIDMRVFYDEKCFRINGQYGINVTSLENAMNKVNFHDHYRMPPVQLSVHNVADKDNEKEIVKEMQSRIKDVFYQNEQSSKPKQLTLDFSQDGM